MDKRVGLGVVALLLIAGGFGAGSRVSDEPISSQPYLHVYPRFFFLVRGNGLIYREAFGFFAWCRKIGKLVVSDRVHMQDTRITTRMWQGQLVGTESHAGQNTAAGGPL